MKFYLPILLLAATSGARAALVFSGPQDIPIPTTFSGVSVDLINRTSFNGDPAPDWSDSQINFFFGGDGIFSGPRLLPVRSGNGASDPVIALDPGDLVSLSSLVGPVGTGSSLGHVGTGAGRFESGAEGYLGFRLDLTGGGDFVNGFMRVTLNNDNLAGMIHDWTYSDTPGESVTVGVIPEPSATLIGTIGMALLLGARRHRPTANPQ